MTLKTSFYRLTIVTSSIPSPSVAENILRIWLVHVNHAVDLKALTGMCSSHPSFDPRWATRSVRTALNIRFEGECARRYIECLAFWYVIRQGKMNTGLRYIGEEPSTRRGSVAS